MSKNQLLDVPPWEDLPKKKFTGPPRFTKLPPGEADGARDLQDWSQRRRGGKGGTQRGRKAKVKLRLRCRECGRPSEVLVAPERKRFPVICPGCGHVGELQREW